MFSFRRLAVLLGLAAVGTKPAIVGHWQVGGEFDVGPSGGNGLLKALEFHTNIAVDAHQVNGKSLGSMIQIPM